MSYNLSTLSARTLDAIEGNYDKNPVTRLGWYKESHELIRRAREQGGRTQLQVIDQMEKLFKRQVAQIEARYSSSKIKIDGDLSEWDQSSWDYFVPSDKKNWNDTCFYALKWDKKNLYVAFKVQNSNLQALKKNRDVSGLHMDDGIELLIDANLDRSEKWEDDDLSYHINVFNAITDDRGLNSKGEYNNSWNGNAKTSVKILGTINDNSDRDTGYYVEVAIRWEEIGKSPKKNSVMGINLCVNDRDDRNNSYRYFDYMSLEEFHYPAGFAELVLLD